MSMNQSTNPHCRRVILATSPSYLTTLRNLSSFPPGPQPRRKRASSAAKGSMIDARGLDAPKRRLVNRSSGVRIIRASEHTRAQEGLARKFRLRALSSSDANSPFQHGKDDRKQAEGGAVCCG